MSLAKLKPVHEIIDRDCEMCTKHYWHGGSELDYTCPQCGIRFETLTNSVDNMCCHCSDGETKKYNEQLEKKTQIHVAMLWDFDLTISEEYQQKALLDTYMKNYQAYYNQPDRIAELQKFNPDFKGFTCSDDFWELITAKRKQILIKDPKARIQKGITWVSQLMSDMQPGKPLENVTKDDLFQLGKKIKLAPCIKECMENLKWHWLGKGVKIHHYVISVGLKDMIAGCLEGFGNIIDAIYACEISDQQIVCLVEDYSKTEIAYMIAKGNDSLRDVKLRADQYFIPYNRFIVIGDGGSDIPLWTFLRKRDGKCILVYKEGDMEEYKKAMSISFNAASYVLERSYYPGFNNPTWIYLNQCIKEIVNRKCDHSYASIDHYKWGKIVNRTEREEIEKHLAECPEHGFGNTLTHVIPLQST